MLDTGGAEHSSNDDSDTVTPERPVGNQDAKKRRLEHKSEKTSKLEQSASDMARSFSRR